jgi:hypothetical protein
MEPLEYEKFVITNRAESEKDPLRSVLTFPADDIELLEIVKKIPTVEHSKPEIELVQFNYLYTLKKTIYLLN